jgi:hypothetical protein
MIYRMAAEPQPRDLGPDPDVDLTAVEPVHVTPGYHAEISVPLTSAQLVAVERYAAERGVGVAEAAQALVAAGIAARGRR